MWWRDGRVIDDSFVTTYENTVRNDLWLPSLSRHDLDAQLTCEASNSNLTAPVSTSVTIDLFSKFSGSKSSYTAEGQCGNINEMAAVRRFGHPFCELI